MYSVLPIYNRSLIYNPVQEFMTLLLHDELNKICQKQRAKPTKWTKTFRLDNYQPEEVKVAVTDGYVRIHAKHVNGDETDENCDVRQSKRSIKIPEGVDQSKIHCFMKNDHHYTVEAPILPNVNERETEIKIEETPTDSKEKSNDDKTENTDDRIVEKDQTFKTELDLSVFDPEHIKIRRNKNVVTITAEQTRDKDGIQVLRKFRRELTVPDCIDHEQMRCHLGADGSLSITAPKHNDTKSANKNHTPDYEVDVEKPDYKTHDSDQETENPDQKKEKSDSDQKTKDQDQKTENPDQETEKHEHEEQPSSEAVQENQSD